MKAKINKTNIELRVAQPVDLAVEAAVIVSDPNLTVAPQLAERVGSQVQAECKRIGWADVGTAVMTSAGQLTDIMKLIHAVAPRWGEGSERGKLANVVWECLRIAENSQLKSIALPAISVGTLGFPLESCANVMLTRIIDYTFEDTRSLRQVVVALADDMQLDVFKAEFERQISDLRQSGEGRVRA